MLFDIDINQHTEIKVKKVLIISYYWPPKTGIGVQHLPMHDCETVIFTTLDNDLKDGGIVSAIQYPKALPFLEAHSKFGFKQDDFPVASMVQEEILSLPLFPEMREEEIAFVIENANSID